MAKRSCCLSSIRVHLLLICLWCGILETISSGGGGGGAEGGFGAHVVKREERRTLVSTEYGEISAARVWDNINGSTSYLLHFFTLEPNSLFLPVVLHADMVFYVHTGSGKLSWTEGDELKSTDLRGGDVYRLQEGAVFFIQSNLETETERQKLRIHAIFANSDNDLHEEPATGPYSSIRDMVLGFDKKVLQAAFMVPEEEIEELFNGAKPPAIIHEVSKTKGTAFGMEAQFRGSLLGSRTYNIFELNKKKTKGGSRLFNLFKEDKDFENCNGWSTTVTRKKLSALKDTDIGLFMVNLTTGSMMGPHWNPVATEIGVVLQGRGMVRVVCSGISKETGCRNMRYEVEEGDIFAVPRFHAMAQMAFNNETLVFMGFSTSANRNHPQFLAGQASVFRTLDKDVVALSFNIKHTTMHQLLASQQDSVILGCISCAEEELRIMEEEIEREREAAREREEEEARKREEEQQREEEEARKREEEEARRQEEERKRREEEEERKRQEEEARKREEEAARKEEEERKRQEEAAAARREEEEERQRQEEEATKREEEATRKEAEERERREEEEAARREEEARKREEEAARREEKERKRREEEEEAARRREEEEERKRQEEEAREREEEAARREEEERERRQEKEEAARREEGEETRRRQQQQEQEEEEEAQRRQEQEEEARHEQEEEEEAHQKRHKQEKEEQQEHQGGRGEEEQAEEEERRRQEEAEREEEATTRHGGEQERWQEEEEQGSGSSRRRVETKLEHENQGDEGWGIILKTLTV